MDTSSTTPSNDDPPRASLLGLPAELRLAIYDFIFHPIEHRRRKSLAEHKDERKSGVQIPGLSVYICNNGYEHWRDIIMVIPGNAEQPEKNRDHMTAIFSVPFVCRQVRTELRDLVAEIPPISQILLMFDQFTRKDMEQFMDAIGGKSARHIREWYIVGSGNCKHVEYRSGHLFKGWYGGPGPCSFFEHEGSQCNRNCEQAREGYKNGRCERSITVQLDKHEQDDRVQRNVPYKNVWRVDNVRAEDRLKRVNRELSHDRDTAKKALLMCRHVVLSECRNSTSREKGNACYCGDPLDHLFNEKGGFEVRRETFVSMLGAVTGET